MQSSGEIMLASSSAKRENVSKQKWKEPYSNGYNESIIYSKSKDRILIFLMHFNYVHNHSYEKNNQYSHHFLTVYVHVVVEKDTWEQIHKFLIVMRITRGDHVCYSSGHDWQDRISLTDQGSDSQ